jgi:adenylate cyclase
METTPPFQVVSGQRQLAVIMFTDAVGYSAKMHAEEVATLNLLERDLLLMRQVIGDRGGTVLKSTGDGLLVQFSSAVQAVSCAVEIQRRFADRLVPGKKSKGLRHRISVHLGDVFAGGGDVLGDGVTGSALRAADGAGRRGASSRTW